MSEIDRWHWSGSLCLYKDGKLVDEMKHSPLLSSPSPAVVLYADHAAELAALRARVAELEAALSDVTADDFMARYNALRSDAERYRFLRDRAGNAIMQQLMADCVPSGWNTKVDAALAAEVKK